MHNLYMNSLAWMPECVRDKYETLRRQRETGQAHKLKKQTFNVCFFKAFGSKQLFWHLVKVGTDTQDLNELLCVWADVRKSSSYQALCEASKQKCEKTAEMKRQVTRAKMQVLNAAWRRASKEDYDAAVAKYEAAKLQWKTLDRNTQHKGMHQLLETQA